MKSAVIIVTGFVQGVGYRKFVKDSARKLGLTGWVRNLPDRTVEACLQGSPEKIEEMLVLCKKGPFLSEVEDISVLWEEAEEFSDFSIRHDL
ncbi:MAG: acylphosphatase [Candidatus Levyibacteriota bacterium]